MKSMEEIWEDYSYVPKEGDVKVDAEELGQLLWILHRYQEVFDMIPNEHIKDALKKKRKFGFEYTEYFLNKYVVLGNLRNNEKEWYDLFKISEKLGDEKAKNQAFNTYVEIKKERERLNIELKELKKEHFNGFSYI